MRLRTCKMPLKLCAWSATKCTCGGLYRAAGCALGSELGRQSATVAAGRSAQAEEAGQGRAEVWHQGIAAKAKPAGHTADSCLLWAHIRRVMRWGCQAQPLLHTVPATPPAGSQHGATTALLQPQEHSPACLSPFTHPCLVEA